MAKSKKQPKVKESNTGIFKSLGRWAKDGPFVLIALVILLLVLQFAFPSKTICNNGVGVQGEVTRITTSRYDNDLTGESALFYNIVCRYPVGEAFQENWITINRGKLNRAEITLSEGDSVQLLYLPQRPHKIQFQELCN